MMPKPLSRDKKDELERLRDRILLTLDFIDNVEPAATWQQIRDIVRSASATGNLRSMRMIARDVDESTTALPAYQREGLEALLRARLGVDKDAERAATRQRVAEIIGRGTIASEKERQHLERYLEMLEATDGDPAEIDAVGRLLRGA